MRAARIAINGQLASDKRYGGVQQVLVGLVNALGQLEGDTEEYVIIGPYAELDWLEPHIGRNQRLISGPKLTNTPIKKRSSADLFKSILRTLRPFVAENSIKLLSILHKPARIWPEVPVSDGFYERLGCQVIHFPFQEITLCSLPTIYNPHDLQHLHYPQFFTPTDITWRNRTYSTGCRYAQTVVVASQWVKDDLVDHYRLSPNKIQVIPWAPPTQVFQLPLEENLSVVREKYDLKLPFAFYPSVTWEHKNHIRLLRALAILRDRHDLIVNLVCTGEKYPRFWPRIQEEIVALRLQAQVEFLGNVTPETLRAIYRLAQFVVIPTLFEAASGPMFEAWADSVPVVCSNVTSLPEQAGDAALLFDPFSTDAIANALLRMVTAQSLREEYIRRGKRRLKDFSWERTAKTYRAVYRRAARFPLSEEDRWLLSWDWMRKPDRRDNKASDE